ncbi:hypothetical protein [Microbacterium sp. NIBRBAC000506063]|uniref:hypothetical protein n=1 Tax=Microbacterium sp. NIBRBAC000506063 TaxID=2734618 RepID=UPI001BB800C3|nr:hypothetical protein [Microbacterium sp. NIBRBAC000506063]QTV80529.1 hypothetical protein KAE78_06535 [Microbacterium sp. NIBRBAC000506063]
MRVEKYSLPDGTEEFVVYIAGTRSLAGDDPWNMSSNLDLYFGDASASYEAVRQALSAAGAEPGAVVHAVGHSQGGMIAGRLGMEGEYDVRSVLTAGSPVEPALPDSTLSVQLRHTDDIVSSLAGGGSPAGTGSPDSMVVQRVGDPGHGLHDLSLPPHHLERYLDTAGMLDASGDARLGALDQLWTRLTSATAVQATEFAATTRNADRGSAASGR